MNFSALILALPTRRSTTRMRVWRALKETGCGVLRDGVYVLPAGAHGAEVLTAMETEIALAGGFAMTLDLKLRSEAQLAQVRKLFDRSADYGALVRDIGAAKSGLPVSISKQTTPNAQMSARVSTRRPVACSGAM